MATLLPSIISTVGRLSTTYTSPFRNSTYAFLRRSGWLTGEMTGCWVAPNLQKKRELFISASRAPLPVVGAGALLVTYWCRILLKDLRYGVILRWPTWVVLAEVLDPAYCNLPIEP